MAVERQGVWRRCDLYTILFIPLGERHPFAVVRLLQGEVEYDEPGDAQFKPERFEHVSLAVDRAHERWAEHCISLDYVNALTGCDDKPMLFPPGAVGPKLSEAPSAVNPDATKIAAAIVNLFWMRPTASDSGEGG